MSELLIDVGDFRGAAIGGAVSKTTNGYPQVVLQLHATDVYDGEAGEFYDDAVDGDITAYICLFGGNGKATLGVQQVTDAFGWDGASFNGLNDLVKDLTSRPGGHPIGFSTESHEYNGVVSTQVSWVRGYENTPGRTIKECTPAELKDLDKQYAKGLQATKGKAKATTPKPVTRPKPPTQAAPATQTEAAPSAAEATSPPAPTATGKSTKGKAWVKFTTANKAEATDKSGGGAGLLDDELAEIWTTVAKEVAGVAANDKQITREQWFQIQEICVDRVTIPF